MVLAPLLALVLAAPGERTATLARLADAAAAEIARAAAGRPVEVLPPEDRTGSASGPALREVLQQRLAERGLAAAHGPRLRVLAILSTSARRARLSGRLLQEPGGFQVDAFSVSVEGSLLATGASSDAGSPAVAWSAPLVDAPLGRPVLALALLGPHRALLVSADVVTLAELAPRRVREAARLALPRPWPVRAPGGLLSCDTRSSCWVLTSHMTEAVLVATDGPALAEIARADVLPWPDAPGGARFRAGTDLVEVEVPGLPDGPYARVGPGVPAFAVSPLGRLGVGGGPWTSFTAGAAGAPLWPGAAVVTARVPPGAADALRVVALDAGAPREEGSLAVAGAVRAVAAEVTTDGARVAAVVEDHAGELRLRVYDVTRLTRR